MNGIQLPHSVHYHNSVTGLDKGGKYKPNTSIKTESLTDKYTVNGDIGRGKFAVVKKCINNETGDVVAAKFIKKRRRGKSCREEILREVVMLEMALAHPRLVDLKEVFETTSELILITEYCAGGELFTECVIEESFVEADVVRMMRQILEGLVYLHQQHIVHLDLKPQNILLTKPFPKGDIKLCDLGFACLVNTGEDIRDIIGTPDYVAPEVLSYEPLGLYTDMWSLGVLTYVMLTAHSPFSGDSQQETFLNISQVNLDFPDSLFSNISLAAQDFIQQLLVKDPSDRLTAKQCLDHPWVSGKVMPASGITESEAVSKCQNKPSGHLDNAEEETQNDKQDRLTEKRKMNIDSGEALQGTIKFTNTDFLSPESNLENENLDNKLQQDKSASRTDIGKDFDGASKDNIYRTHLEIIPTKILKCNLSSADTQTLSEKQPTIGDVAHQKGADVINILCPQKECQSMELDNSDDVISNYGNRETEMTHI